MKVINRRAGHTSDASKNHEFTDWDAVQRFADLFAAEVVAHAMEAIDPPTTVPLGPQA